MEQKETDLYLIHKAKTDYWKEKIQTFNILALNYWNIYSKYSKEWNKIDTHRKTKKTINNNDTYKIEERQKYIYFTSNWQ